MIVGQLSLARKVKWLVQELRGGYTSLHSSWDLILENSVSVKLIINGIGVGNVCQYQVPYQCQPIIISAWGQFGILSAGMPLILYANNKLCPISFDSIWYGLHVGSLP